MNHQLFLPAAAKAFEESAIRKAGALAGSMQVIITTGSQQGLDPIGRVRRGPPLRASIVFCAYT